MTEYRPCPWCGVDVTTTAPLKKPTTIGSVAQSSPPGVFWDRTGGRHTEKGSPRVRRSTSSLRHKGVIEEQIVVGDVVRFRGGGTPMTVEKIEGDEAICVFSLGGRQRLKLEVLEKVPDEHHWRDRG